MWLDLAIQELVADSVSNAEVPVSKKASGSVTKLVIVVAALVVSFNPLAVLLDVVA